MSDAKSDRDWISGVASDEIVTIGDPRLRNQTSRVRDPAEVTDVLRNMVSRVRKTDVFPDRPTSRLLQMINPVIIEQSGDSASGWEGCFSVPA